MWLRVSADFCCPMLSLIAVEAQNVSYIFYPFGLDEGDSVLVGDDVSSPAVKISYGFPYIYRTHRMVFVSINSTFASYDGTAQCVIPLA